MRVAAHPPSLDTIPVDFFADPDGRWEYDALVRSAGFDPALVGVEGQLAIGALTQPYAGFPAGAAVVMLSTSRGSAVALVDCASATSAAA